MGFPLWTLFGMALTAFGALVMLIVAYVAQSPKLLRRLGLSGSRLDLKARTFTGYALALVLLAFGFFIAGVPLGAQAPVIEVANATPIVDTNESGAMVFAATATPEIVTEALSIEEPPKTDSQIQPVTGAFAGPPASAQTATAEVIAASQEEAPTATATAYPSATPTSTQTASPTPTPSPTATVTPTSTMTPTPIFEETAVINTGSSTLWVKRTPGGRDMAILNGGDVVVLLAGHANVGGILWREISAVDGTIGWVSETYLDTGIEGDSESN